MRSAQNDIYLRGVKYFREHSYYKAYECLIDCPVGCDEFSRSMFSAMGSIFLHKTQKGEQDLAKEAFRCFEKAYLIVKERQKAVVDTDNDAISMYDMAYAYIEGIGTGKDIGKGLEILRDIDRMLTSAGRSIRDVDDDFGIIRDHYLPVKGE